MKKQKCVLFLLLIIKVRQGEDNKCYIISQKQLIFANLAKYIGVYLAISTLIYIFVAKFKFTLTMIIGRKREIEELWILYEIGLSAQWHYYISIFILVFISGTVKIHLCKKICDMKVTDYIMGVVWPCSFVMIISIMATQLLQGAMDDYHVLLVVTMQIILIFVLESLFGLTKSERTAILSKVKSRVNHR